MFYKGSVMIYRDKYVNTIKSYLDKPVIKVITGMRRVGKSTILKMISAELQSEGFNVIYINKESLEFNFIRNYLDLYEYFKQKLNSNIRNYLFVDEIQEIEKWEKTITSIQSDNLADIIITGSNAEMLSSELATLISGRYVEIKIFGLNFNEFTGFSKTNTEDIDAEFSNYLKYGGLPGIHSFIEDFEMVNNYLGGIINTVLFKDVITRNSIRNVSILDKIVKFVFDNIGNITSSKGISDYFKSQKIKVNIETVHNYMKFLESAYLVYRIPRYDLKGKRYLEFYDKIYVGDVGLRHGLIGYKDRDISGLLENIVLLYLMSKNYKLSIGVYNQYEIDFIAEKDNNRIYFQITQALNEQSTIDREFNNLKRIDDNYRKIVLSLEKFFPNNIDGIEHFYLPEFLHKDIL